MVYHKSLARSSCLSVYLKCDCTKHIKTLRTTHERASWRDLCIMGWFSIYDWNIPLAVGIEFVMIASLSKCRFTTSLEGMSRWTSSKSVLLIRHSASGRWASSFILALECAVVSSVSPIGCTSMRIRQTDTYYNGTHGPFISHCRLDIFRTGASIKLKVLTACSRDCVLLQASARMLRNWMPQTPFLLPFLNANSQRQMDLVCDAGLCNLLWLIVW